MRSLLVITCLFGLLVCPVATMAAGDGVFHPGAAGYAYRSAADTVDLDYSKDFSAEGVINLEPHATGGTYAPIVSKTNNLYGTTAGFGMGTTHISVKDNYGQFLTAKVGDAAHSAVILNASKTFQGPTYAVMVWDSQARNLKFYVNGSLNGSAANALIVPANIKNSYDLRIGKLPDGYLQRDVLMARVWNRQLSAAEVSALWQSFSSTGRYVLPDGIAKADLLSEWLMQETSDKDGKPGATCIRDSAGSNHLVLMGGGVIFNPAGSLVMTSPLNGAVDVPTAVTLEAAGGMGSLDAANGLKRPLRYEFQIDEADTFQTSALKDSGLISGYSSWKPVLKPATKYFWRVRVADSSDTPVSSSYSGAFSFTTRDAASWYVRPAMVSNYGAQDGKSYANAWNGIRNIKFGVDGVEAGDSLYVCGSHVYRNNFSGDATQKVIRESGFSDDYPITIRMDCPDDEGVVWGYAGDFTTTSSGSVWSGPDLNGVYSSPGDSTRTFPVQDISGFNGTILEKETAITWAGHPGAWFNDGSRLYVKLTDGGNPAGRIYNYPTNNRPGYTFNLGRSNYIKFLNCNFFGSNQGKDQKTNSFSNNPPSLHITYDHCRMKFSNYVMVDIYDGNDNWTVRNSEISDVANAIYTIVSGSQTGANDILVENNNLHDVNTLHFKGYPDGHCVGVQSGHGHVVQYNRCVNSGPAIVFWTYTGIPMFNNTIRYNYISNSFSDGISYGGPHQKWPSEQGMRKGVWIYGNIIQKVGDGISVSAREDVNVYNNIIDDADTAFRSEGAYYPLYLRFKNNIIINPRTQCTYLVSDPVGSVIDWDYNLYFPGANATTGFRAFLNQPFIHDAHSVFAEPGFVSANRTKAEDYKLQPGSPAIDKGVAVAGIPAVDAAGTVIPQGFAPDIGVYEYTTKPPAGTGDVSGNNRVTMYDAALTLRGGLTPAQLVQADINGDNTVDASDAHAIARKALGLN
ncbi:MAG: hypothetical protein HQL22_00155 [Candidatus Omnitrophica bacterium]|nr:hypothetical protein [Candidatus Omnitrophota bacterium]